jgi:hypothetical protein
MPRLFSLRGKVAAIDNQLTVNHLVFNYESPNRRKAWRVEAAWVWPVDIEVNHAADGFMCLLANLSTDTAKYQLADLVDPSENRSFAWAQQTYNHRDAPDDFITPNGYPLDQARFVVDPDTMVTKELYINVGTSTDRDESKSREWGYLILLREEKVTAAQSLFQQIKGMGQDITSGK